MLNGQFEDRIPSLSAKLRLLALALKARDKDIPNMPTS
jgi:hypothetical protein